MSITIKLYNNTDDPKNLVKNVDVESGGISCECTPYEPVDLLNPSFVLNENSNINSCNYLWVSEWDRYYFIDKITKINGGKQIISAHEDVLMSFQKDIKELSGMLSFAESRYYGNFFLNNPNMIPQMNRRTQAHAFTGSLPINDGSGVGPGLMIHMTVIS